MNLKELLFELLDAPGISGAEDGAAEVASNCLSRYMTVTRDTLGSVIGTTDGDGDGVLLDAHLDQIGLFVTSVSDAGFVKVAACGGADLRTMACQPVRVLSKEPLYGVVTSTPPHLRKDADEAPKWEDVAIDVGLPAEKARAIIRPGDRVQLLGAPRELLNGRISAAAIDDRAGIAAILRALDILKERGVRKKLTVVFSVQEEVTGGGAKGAGFASDAATAIAVDVSFATDPLVSEKDGKPLSCGPLIGVAPPLDARIGDTLETLAKERNIPYEIEAMGGGTGTNAEDYAFARCGKRTGLVSIPIRNMHTTVEVCDLKDVENTAQLLAAFIEKEGETA